MGCPAGKPGELELQREILRAALGAAPQFGEAWKIFELPFQWSADGSRAWEAEVREIYRRGLATVSAHIADHQARGESLAGREQQFTLRCNC
jgi:plasmid stability protein